MSVGVRTVRSFSDPANANEPDGMFQEGVNGANFHFCTADHVLANGPPLPGKFFLVVEQLTLQDLDTAKRVTMHWRFTFFLLVSCLAVCVDDHEFVGSLLFDVSSDSTTGIGSCSCSSGSASGGRPCRTLPTVTALHSLHFGGCFKNFSLRDTPLLKLGHGFGSDLAMCPA